MEIVKKDLPNFGVLETRLNKKVVSELNKIIENSLKDNENFNDKLAGNISTSLKIKDKNNILNATLISLVNFYHETYGESYHPLTMNKKYGLNVDSLWVNFQKQGEFNPPHNHSGGYSFVIWIKIPTDHKEQKELPIAKNSSSDLKISNFSFLYPDITGKIREFVYPMSKNKEGLLVFFPSILTHQVYPFYNSSETRISIAGNLGIVETV